MSPQVVLRPVQTSLVLLHAASFSALHVIIFLVMWYSTHAICFFGRIQGEERSIWVEDVYTCIDTHACGVASQCGSEIGPWIRATVKIHTHLAIHPEGLEKDHRRLNPKDKKQDLHKQHTYSLWIFLTHAETIKFFLLPPEFALLWADISSFELYSLMPDLTPILPALFRGLLGSSTMQERSHQVFKRLPLVHIQNKFWLQQHWNTKSELKIMIEVGHVHVRALLTSVDIFDQIVCKARPRASPTAPRQSLCHWLWEPIQ